MQCHGGAKTYMELFHNNGLDSIFVDAGIEKLSHLPKDKGRFKAPTLRNIALTAPYMHDGRFRTLKEVVDHYRDHIVPSPSLSSLLKGMSKDRIGKQLNLTEKEKSQIITFLTMLTDSAFITDQRFSDPQFFHTKQKDSQS